MERHRSVLLTDLDGVVFWRLPAQKAGIPIIGHRDPRSYEPEVDVRGYSKELDRRVTLFYLWQAARHVVVPVFPDVTKVLEEFYRDGGIIYGNTGRHLNPAMEWATWTSLRIAGVADNFDGIFFRQKGVSTGTSKTVVVDQVVEDPLHEGHEIRVVDDNPIDLLPMAARHLHRETPNISFKLIRDWTTNRLLRGVNLQHDFPNVTVVRTLREGLLG